MENSNELITKISKNSNNTTALVWSVADNLAGAYFTSYDIIYLMSDLLIACDEPAFTRDGISKTVDDMTMETSQMFTCMEERLKQMDTDADVTVFGQEFNPFTFGIVKAGECT